MADNIKTNFYWIMRALVLALVLGLVSEALNNRADHATYKADIALLSQKVDLKMESIDEKLNILIGIQEP